MSSINKSKTPLHGITITTRPPSWQITWDSQADTSETQENLLYFLNHCFISKFWSIRLKNFKKYFVDVSMMLSKQLYMIFMFSTFNIWWGSFNSLHNFRLVWRCTLEHPIWRGALNPRIYVIWRVYKGTPYPRGELGLLNKTCAVIAE